MSLLDWNAAAVQMSPRDCGKALVNVGSNEPKNDSMVDNAPCGVNADCGMTLVGNELNPLMTI